MIGRSSGGPGNAESPRVRPRSRSGAVHRVPRERKLTHASQAKSPTIESGVIPASTGSDRPRSASSWNCPKDRSTLFAPSRSPGPTNPRANSGCRYRVRYPVPPKVSRRILHLSVNCLTIRRMLIASGHAPWQVSQCACPTASRLRRGSLRHRNGGSTGHHHIRRVQRPTGHARCARAQAVNANRPPNRRHSCRAF